MLTHQQTEKEIFGHETFFREVGLYISNMEQYERSLKFFDRSIKSSPNDKRALLGRSRARARAVHYEGALEDVHKILEMEPENLTAWADKTLVTYLCGEFEESLLQNSRMVFKRHKPDNFQVGIMHCSNAIENCLATRAGRPLRDHFKIIRKLAWKKYFEEHSLREPKPRNKPKHKQKKRFGTVEPNVIKCEQDSRHGSIKSSKAVNPNTLIRDSLHSKKADSFVVPRLEEPYYYKPLQNYTTNIENYISERYLGKMYKDKMFLKTFASLPGANGPNETGYAKIKSLAHVGYHNVSCKQEMMRTRRPFYFIKYQEAKISGNLRKRQADELEWLRETAKKDADTLLSKLVTAYGEKKLKIILDLAEKLKEFCDSKNKNILPNKEMYLSELYELVCKGYYEVFRIAKNHTELQKKYRVEVLLGLEQHDSLKSDSVLDFMHETLVDHKKDISVLEKLLKDAVAPGEMCWYFYELARHHIELNKHEIARVYLRRCIQKAEDFEYLQWNIISTMLIVKSQLQQRLKNDALNDLKKVQVLAKELKDAKLHAFVKRCLDIVDKTELSKSSDPQSQLVTEREKGIIKMMTTGELKAEVAHLFSQMSSMPSSRRMNILPGVTTARPETPSRKMRASVKMSILPVSKDKSDELLNRKFPEKPGDGAQFMQLIQYHV